MRKKRFFIKILFFLFFINFYSAQNYYENGSQCYGYLTELVRTSNFPFRIVSKEKINLLMDTDENGYILAQLIYDKNKKDIDPETNTFGTIGWIKYDILSKKLYNVSGDIDPEHPMELSFNIQYSNLFNLCRSCEDKEIKARQSEISYYPREIFKVTGKNRVYFYSSPDENCKISSNLFIIHNDEVIVYSEYADFYFVMYMRKNGEDVTGWVHKKLLESTGKNIGPNN